MEKEISIKVNARHVGQLGRELVTDYVTALTELVKNSYDADGEGVEVAFTNMLSGEGKIIIADTGCGFSSDDIETKWAVIGTSSKVKNPYSKKYKRRCVGRKGIGRYSVERLAEYCTLYSFTKDNRPVKYYMNWNKYEGIDFNELKQRVEILENSPDFESAKYIKRAVEYLLVSERIDIDSKNIIREKILKNNKLDFSIFYSKETLGNIQQFLYPMTKNAFDNEIDELIVRKLKKVGEVKEVDEDYDLLYELEYNGETFLCHVAMIDIKIEGGDKIKKYISVDKIRAWESVGVADKVLLIFFNQQDQEVYYYKVRDILQFGEIKNVTKCGYDLDAMHVIEKLN